MKSATKLPAVIRREISKLPDAPRDVVQQRLRTPPPPPVTYESAVRQLISVRDVDEIAKKGFIAADALALWARIWNDNRALVEAQKIKAFALRQMYLAAKELGDPYRVLIDSKVGSRRAEQGKHLASYSTKEQMDDTVDRLANEVRIDRLLGAAERASPSHKAMVSKNLAQNEADNAARVEALRNPDTITSRVLTILGQINWHVRLLNEEVMRVRSLPKAKRQSLHASIVNITNTLDRIDQFLDAGGTSDD